MRRWKMHHPEQTAIMLFVNSVFDPQCFAQFVRANDSAALLQRNDCAPQDLTSR
jgi:hypothetical protein